MAGPYHIQPTVSSAFVSPGSSEQMAVVYKCMRGPGAQVDRWHGKEVPCASGTVHTAVRHVC